MPTRAPARLKISMIRCRRGWQDRRAPWDGASSDARARGRRPSYSAPDADATQPRNTSTSIQPTKAAAPPMPTLTREERLQIGKRRLTNVLGNHNIAVARTLEQKISDAGPPDQRIDPHILTEARNELQQEGRILELRRRNTPWYHLSNTPQSVPIRQNTKRCSATTTFGSAMIPMNACSVSSATTFPRCCQERGSGSTPSRTSFSSTRRAQWITRNLPAERDAAKGVNPRISGFSSPFNEDPLQSSAPRDPKERTFAPKQLLLFRVFWWCALPTRFNPMVQGLTEVRGIDRDVQMPARYPVLKLLIL